MQSLMSLIRHLFRRPKPAPSAPPLPSGGTWLRFDMEKRAIQIYTPRTPTRGHLWLVGLTPLCVGAEWEPNVN